MKIEQKETAKFFLENWLNEAVERCENFLYNINKPLSIDNSFHKKRMFEEHYTLTATLMSIRFAKQLVNHAQKDFKVQLEAFIHATQDAVDVRDMREHSDEYFLGKGKKKEEFFKGSGRGILCDMSSSIQNEQGYMLGNLIAMESIHNECQKLLQYVRKSTL
ncbi:hypothetical protein [Sulfurimonas marina]|uniref:Uncharacterized protein n=1 Tax=Sulfurimonas marina TaxID=2590551 RepID=A0A7M1AUK5_9BACT|nr:hypothetical protein [Sulfurimonas marina]QOP41105.1 hypothetical protein FJR03_04845 [Sulfurimonas marina]